MQEKLENSFVFLSLTNLIYSFKATIVGTESSQTAHSKNE